LNELITAGENRMRIFLSHIRSKDIIGRSGIIACLSIILASVALPFSGTVLQAASSNMPGATITLKVPWRQARITNIVPAFDSVKDLRGRELAAIFPSKSIDVVDGSVAISIGGSPVVIESENTASSPDLFGDLAENSPLGIHGIEDDLPENLAHLKDSGIPWVHLAGPSGLVWDLVEPTPGVYNWEKQDRLFAEFRQMGVKICVVVLAANRWDQGMVGRQRPRFRSPLHMEAYKNFLRAAVKRYSSVVDCWQIENEIDNKMSWEDTPAAYMHLLSAAYAVIKENAPNALVAFAGMSNPRSCRTMLLPMLKTYRKDNPKETCFDIIDLHWSRQFRGTYDALFIGSKRYRLADTLREIRKNLNALAFRKTLIWIAEMSDYSGAPASDPVDGDYVYKSESEQAVSLTRMSLLSLASGASRVFWTGIVDWSGWGGRAGGYFDHVGLVYNRRADQKGAKKIAYYSGKFLSHKLNGCQFETAVPVNSGSNVRVYKFLRKGETLYFAWRDPV